VRLPINERELSDVVQRPNETLLIAPQVDEKETQQTGIQDDAQQVRSNGATEVGHISE